MKKNRNTRGNKDQRKKKEMREVEKGEKVIGRQKTQRGRYRLGNGEKATKKWIAKER